MSAVHSTMQEGIMKLPNLATEENMRTAITPPPSLVEDFSSRSSQLPPRVEALNCQEGNYINEEALLDEEVKQNLDQEPPHNNLGDSTHVDSKVGVNEVFIDEPTLGIPSSQLSQNVDEMLAKEDSSSSSLAPIGSKVDSPKERAGDHKSSRSSKQFKRRDDFEDFAHVATKADMAKVFVNESTSSTHLMLVVDDKDKKPMAINSTGVAKPSAIKELVISLVRPTKSLVNNYTNEVAAPPTINLAEAIKSLAAANPLAWPYVWLPS
ncbi:hypothetical protein CDL15_Pgr022327 [Punica granatum]|uniref:Uncharacterized protein n=1 Tax=Punica granatum TaxID=22663 RepID=A0A218Y3D8_PUNGR|nr:hypothetical protein CDL15_Pgr022327 [Punica granatum]PKI48917.1 hypothetical protein CRG98_030693 [Punica granatum]